MWAHIYNAVNKSFYYSFWPTKSHQNNQGIFIDLLHDLFDSITWENKLKKLLKIPWAMNNSAMQAYAENRFKNDFHENDNNSYTQCALSNIMLQATITVELVGNLLKWISGTAIKIAFNFDN